MASIDVRTPAERAERRKGPTPRYNRREFLAAALAIGAGIAATRAGCKYVEAERADLYPLVKNFPTDLKGVHHVEPIPVPGAKQCIIVVLRAHEPEGNMRLADSEIKSIARADRQNAAAIGDLRANHPEYYSGVAYCEGVAVGQERSEVPALIHALRTIRVEGGDKDKCVPEDHAFALERMFRRRFGSIAPLLLSNQIEVRGMESVELSKRAALLEKHGAHITTAGKELDKIRDEYYEINNKRVQFAFDTIARDWETGRNKAVFPIMLIGNSHNVERELEYWNNHHPNSPPFSAAILLPVELARIQQNLPGAMERVTVR